MYQNLDDQLFNLNEIAKLRDQLTPMMQQFVEIKVQYQDALLFYRMGDFYELFFNDAIVASKELGITLTKRGKFNDQDITMCGVPIHASDDYLNKLISKGHKVAICEQLEDPAEAKKNRGYKAVVKRGVTRLVTPGTLTEEKLLEPGSSNFLMTLGYSLDKGDYNFSLAWIDISTGCFHVKRTDAVNISTDIIRIQPKELLLADGMLEPSSPLAVELRKFQTIITQYPSHFFASQQCEQTIKNYYNIHTLDGVADFSASDKSAIASAILYVNKTQIDKSPSLEFPKLERANETLFIDSAARQSLELTQTLSGKKDGSLLKTLDRTVSSGGARLLRERLVAPLTDAEQIKNRLNSVNFFYNSPVFLEEIRQTIKHTPDILRSLGRLFIDRGTPKDLASLLYAGEICQILSGKLSNKLLPRELSTACAALKNIPQTLLIKLNQALQEELPALKRDGNFIRNGYNQQLDETRQLRDDSRQIIAQLQEKYSEVSNVKNLKIKFNNVLGYFIEVTTLHSTNMLEMGELFIHRQTTANSMRFTTAELADLAHKIANANNDSLKLELEIFDELVKEILEKAEFFRQVSEAISVLDVSSSLALLALEQNYCCPIVDNSLKFNIQGGRHPVVESALNKNKATSFIANDCCLSPDEHNDAGKIWLLTGPNMGGKSTFLRQNALIAIMAQMGSFVPATSAEIGIVDRLFSRVGASDDLANSRSTFMVEMIETASILNQATKSSLVIFDEIGRGTATFDGLSIAWAILEYLHNHNCCRTIFATHFHEMTFLAYQLSRLDNVTIKVKEWQGDLIFLHEIAKGVADKSYGIQVAKLAGLPKAVIERSNFILGKLTEKNQRNNIETLSSENNINIAATNSISEAKAKAKVDEATKLFDYKDDPIYSSLLQLNLDDLTPKQALDKLYELSLKAKAKAKDKEEQYS